MIYSVFSNYSKNKDYIQLHNFCKECCFIIIPIDNTLKHLNKIIFHSQIIHFTILINSFY